MEYNIWHSFVITILIIIIIIIIKPPVEKVLSCLDTISCIYVSIRKYFAVLVKNFYTLGELQRFYRLY